MAYKDKETELLARQRYRNANRERINERNRNWYWRNHDRELAKRRLYLEAHRELIYKANSDWQRKRIRQLGLEIVNAYGGKCICCGETEPLFLEIDHVNNNGSEERREYNIYGTYAFYSWLKSRGFPKDDYQLLCSNCNRGKYRNGGICPHKMKSQ